jgi:hypothetical protein
MRNLVIAAATLAGVSNAQSPPFVSPPHFTSTESLTNNSFPFGSTAVPFRYQQIHDDVPAMVITGMQFRHDSTSTGTVRPAHTLTIDMWISTAVTPAAGAQTTFDNNHGVDKIQCVTNRVINVPANDPSLLPGPWLYDIPFDPAVVFVFAGGPASLCWEVHVTARTNTGTVPMDAVTNSGTTPANPPLAATRGGTGCISTGKTVPMLVVPTATAMNWAGGTGNLTVNASNLQNSGFFAWVNGLDRAQWGAVPLPFVIPGSTGAPSGTCTLYTDTFLLTVGQASATGTASLTLPLTVTPAVHGFTIYTQTLGLDAAANPLGFTTSNVAAQQLVAPYTLPLGGCRIYSSGNLNPTGTVGQTTYLVTRLY